MESQELESQIVGLGDGWGDGRGRGDGREDGRGDVWEDGYGDGRGDGQLSHPPNKLHKSLSDRFGQVL